MKIKQWFTLFCFASCITCVAQQALTNDSILKMVKSGLGENVIVSMIQGQPGNYTVTPDAMVALKNAGVTDKELAAMAAKSMAVESDASGYDALDIGVYYKLRGQWAPLTSEPVNWRTGGILKNIASEGIVHEDVNGRLSGSSSPTKVFTPVDFLIRTPDGVGAADYELVHLHAKKNAREFRTVTGGVFHSSGGSQRDAIHFDQKKIARYTYEVTLSGNLPPGEYAFLEPGFSGSSASGSIGKAYTFRLTE